MRRILRWTSLALTLISTLILVSGCDLTLGPKVKTVFVVAHPGKPVQILSERPVVVPVRLLSEQDAEVEAKERDVSGWVAMPKDHWDRIDKILTEHANERKAP